MWRRVPPAGPNCGCWRVRCASPERSGTKRRHLTARRRRVSRFLRRSAPRFGTGFTTGGSVGGRCGWAALRSAPRYCLPRSGRRCSRGGLRRTTRCGRSCRRRATRSPKPPRRGRQRRSESNRAGRPRGPVGRGRRTAGDATGTRSAPCRRRTLSARELRRHDGRAPAAIECGFFKQGASIVRSTSLLFSLFVVLAAATVWAAAPEGKAQPKVSEKPAVDEPVLPKRRLTFDVSEEVETVRPGISIRGNFTASRPKRRCAVSASWQFSGFVLWPRGRRRTLPTGPAGILRGATSVVEGHS